MSDSGASLGWQVGKVRITRFFETAFDLPCEVLMPGSSATELNAMDWLAPHWSGHDGLVTLTIQALLVEAPGRIVLVDTCLGNDKERQTIGNGLATDFLNRLAAYGVAREQVDTVLCTHLHTDHVGWNTMKVDGKWIPTFPNADYLLAQAEIDGWANSSKGPDDAAMFADSIQPVLDAGLARFVATDHVLCDELRLVATPGHTAGHVSLVIESGGEMAFVTGDMTHHPSQWTRCDWATFVDADAAASTATRLFLREELAQSGSLVIGTHYAEPTAGHVVRRGDDYTFTPHLPD